MDSVCSKIDFKRNAIFYFSLLKIDFKCETHKMYLSLHSKNDSIYHSNKINFLYTFKILSLDTH